MSLPIAFITEPVPISLIAGRYLLFDVDVATYLRRTYHICGVLIGGIPQAPQQNVFLGLPVELQPEEAKLLIEKEVAYLVDDLAWHTEFFKTEDKKRYTESIRSQGANAKRLAEESARERSKKALSRQAILKARKEASEGHGEGCEPSDTPLSAENEDHLLFDTSRPTSLPSNSHNTSTSRWAVTPTTTYSSISPSQSLIKRSDILVSSSYPLFEHLHSKDYYVMPGLRFGCNYNVYPGDPLRFHSHFLAVGYDWDEDIPMLDLIGGGRLGTAVKKGFLIGGADSAVKENGKGMSNGENVRTFCLEWGGM